MQCGWGRGTPQWVWYKVCAVQSTGAEAPGSDVQSLHRAELSWQTAPTCYKPFKTADVARAAHFARSLFCSDGIKQHLQACRSDHWTLSHKVSDTSQTQSGLSITRNKLRMQNRNAKFITEGVKIVMSVMEHAVTCCSGAAKINVNLNEPPPFDKIHRKKHHFLQCTHCIHA